ncbi:MAG TPA: adenylate/guanylate cyclase domain-containing protein [Acidimicrobiales bacterium]
MRPPIRYLKTTDGVRLAYTVHGEGPPLVFARGWISHVDLFWDDLDFRTYFEAIATRFTVVRFDMRGVGLSDRNVEDKLSLDELVLDLEAVFDGLDLERAVLYATCYAGPIAVRYAAAHPDRVEKLVLDGTYASGPELSNEDLRASVMNAVGLFSTSPSAAHAVLHYFTRGDGSGPADEKFRRNRQSITAEVAKPLYEMSFEWDVTPDCEAVTSPALVLHRRGSMAVPVALGQRLASLLPDASFVAVDGREHNTWEGDATQPLAALAHFLGAPIDRAYTRRVQLRPTIVLFTDSVGSTARAAQLGDEPAQLIARVQNAIVHQGLEDHGGKRVKGTGDGVLAEFNSVSQALRAAAAIQKKMAEHNAENQDSSVRIRIGINAGEPLAEDDDLHGVMVNTAARICELAHGGEVLVSGVVRELARGKGFTFSDAGPADLRGLDEPVHLYRLELPTD